LPRGLSCNGFSVNQVDSAKSSR